MEAIKDFPFQGYSEEASKELQGIQGRIKELLDFLNEERKKHKKKTRREAVQSVADFASNIHNEIERNVFLDKYFKIKEGEEGEETLLKLRSSLDRYAEKVANLIEDLRKVNSGGKKMSEEEYQDHFH